MSNRTFLSTQSDSPRESSPTLVQKEEASETGTLSPPVGEPTGPAVVPDRTTVLPRLESGPPPRLVLEAAERYQPVRLLGEGGMGSVELVNDQDIGRQVARKKLHPELRSPGGVGRFVGEVRTIGRLEHPNIVPIHDVGQDVDGSYYFVMKYVEGETLESIIERLERGDADTHKAWPFERRVEVVKAVLRALTAAHAQGILHRDVKPANVMVGRYGEVFLTDWGIARTIGATEEPAEERVASGRVGGSTRVGALIGTLSCMSPEQLRGEHHLLDARSDLYAVGLLLYEFLSLRHPWRGVEDPATIATTQQHLKLASISGTRHPRQGLPPVEYLYLCDDLCAYKAEDRVPSAAVALQMIEALERGEVPVRCHVTFTKRMTRESGHWVERYPNATFVVMVAGAATSLVGFGVLAGIW